MNQLLGTQMPVRNTQGAKRLKIAPGGWMEWLGSWLRRLLADSSAGQPALRIEARLNMGARKSLVLVNCRGRQVLLALSGEAIATVLNFCEDSVEQTAPARRRARRAALAADRKDAKP